MAILIPAKNIYKKQYEKLVDNAVDLIQVKTAKSSQDMKTDTVFELSVTGDFYIKSTKYIDQEFSFDEIASSRAYNIAFAYAHIQPYVFERASLKISKDEIKKEILSCNDLNFNVVCNVKKGKTSAKFSRSGLDNVISNLTFKQLEESIQTFAEFELSETASANASNTWASAEAIIDNIKTTMTVSDKGDYHAVTFWFVSGIQKYNLQGAQTMAERDNFGNFTLDLEGTYEYIIPQQVNVTISGIVKTIDFVENTESFGNLSSKNALIVGEGNELMQQSAFVQTTEGTYYISNLYKDVQEKFKNGKKILTLLCDINDYYYYLSTAPDYKGSKAISLDSTSLTFKENDVVVPMIKKADGTSVPIDTDEKGKPMEFVVLAVKVFYDGAVWQELTLQQN